MSGDAIENAAREYVEIIWMGGEPVESPDAIFVRVMHRKPTRDESRRIMERVKELLRGLQK